MTPDQIEQREQAERKRKTANEQYALDVRWVMSTPAGRRVMWSLLGDLGLYRTPYGASTRTPRTSTWASTRRRCA